MKKENLIKEIFTYVVIILVVVIIRTYIITPVVVSGDSMKPNLQDGELLLIQKIGYNSSAIKRADVVVIKIKENNKEEEIIKRIIGLPGEHISYKNNKLYVNDKIVEEHENSFEDEELPTKEELNNKLLCKLNHKK